MTGIFQMIFGGVQQAASQLVAQSGMVSGIQDQFKGFIPTVQGSWIGGDEEAFAQDVTQRLVPKTIELIVAFSGVNVNLTQSISTVQSADRQVMGMVNELADEFGGI